MISFRITKIYFKDKPLVIFTGIVDIVPLIRIGFSDLCPMLPVSTSSRRTWFTGLPICIAEFFSCYPWPYAILIWRRAGIIACADPIGGFVTFRNQLIHKSAFVGVSDGYQMAVHLLAQVSGKGPWHFIVIYCIGMTVISLLCYRNILFLTDIKGEPVALPATKFWVSGLRKNGIMPGTQFSKCFWGPCFATR